MVYIVAGQLHSRANQRAQFWCHLGSQWERSIIFTQRINEARLDLFSMEGLIVGITWSTNVTLGLYIPSVSCVVKCYWDGSRVPQLVHYKLEP